MPPAENRRPVVLCVDDESSIRSALRRVFMEEEWDLLFAEDGAQGLRICEEARVDLILSDFRMPGMDGVEFLTKAKKVLPDCVRIVLSGYADINLIVHALNEGEIYRFLVKPWNDEELLHNLRKALEHLRLGRENTRLAEQLLRLNEELSALNIDLERKVDERTAELREMNQRLQFVQVIVEMLPTPVMGVNADRVVMFANAKARAIFDPAGMGLVGVSAPQAFEPELTGAIQRALAGQGRQQPGNQLATAQVLPMVFAGTAVGTIVLAPEDAHLDFDRVKACTATTWTVPVR